MDNDARRWDIDNEWWWWWMVMDDNGWLVP